ncbi:DUF397 domain-containing protein [Streptomyces sp. LE64]
MRAHDGRAEFRDSKRVWGPVVPVSADGWSAFVAGIQDGALAE